ncbi:MAG: hypothetical protein HRT88_18385 [Lentisphaeraceae bacterium]|nr:hypothetical protein [Lentisphaeraceae bacterium]
MDQSLRLITYRQIFPENTAALDGKEQIFNEDQTRIIKENIIINPQRATEFPGK